MLRETLLSAMGSFWTWSALLIAPKTPLPTKRCFTTQLRGQDRVKLMFIPCEVGVWHVVAVLYCHNTNPLLIDSGVGRCWIAPLPTEAVVTRYQARVKPDYVVDVVTDFEGHMLHSTVGPVTCVTLAKRLIGVHNPGLVTSRQLLSHLWRLSDGRS